MDIIYIASKNKDKVNAVKTIFPDSTINDISIASDVKEQPIDNETLKGCRNRINNLEKYVIHNKLKYNILISIENGIDTKKNQDFCVIMIKDNQNFNEYNIGSFTDLPSYQDNKTYFVQESLKNNCNITCGSIIEKMFNYEQNSWHTHYGKSRYELIRDQLSELVSNKLGIEK
jgi:hypothetical protein